MGLCPIWPLGQRTPSERWCYLIDILLAPVLLVEIVAVFLDRFVAREPKMSGRTASYFASNEASTPSISLLSQSPLGLPPSPSSPPLSSCSSLGVRAVEYALGECAAKRCDLRLVTAGRQFRALHFQRETRAPGALSAKPQICKIDCKNLKKTVFFQRINI